MLVVENEVSDQWRCEETGEGQDVRDRIDVFVRGEGEETGLEGGFAGIGAGLASVPVGRRKD